MIFLFFFLSYLPVFCLSILSFLFFPTSFPLRSKLTQHYCKTFLIFFFFWKVKKLTRWQNVSIFFFVCLSVCLSVFVSGVLFLFELLSLFLACKSVCLYLSFTTPLSLSLSFWHLTSFPNVNRKCRNWYLSSEKFQKCEINDNKNRSMDDQITMY